MKTLTIEHSMVESLDSDDSKLAFINSIITLLTDNKPANSTAYNILSNGLNINIPEPLDGAPTFHSNDMGVSEVRRFFMVKAGFVPVNFNCSYKDYKFQDIKDMSDSELSSYIICLTRKIQLSTGKRDYLKFLNYIQLAINIYCIRTDRESCICK